MASCPVTGTILAIDLGTSSIKLLAVSRTGEVVARVRVPHNTMRPSPDAAEQDVSGWWRNLGRGIRSLAAELRMDISAIAVTGQMHGLVVQDEHGRVLRPAITWQDQRSGTTLPRLLDTIAGTSGSIAAGYQAAIWHWLSQHEPERTRSVRRILLPKDEIIHRLTGKHVTDPSDAVGTGWFDPMTSKWNTRIVEAAGASIDHLPRIVPSGSVVGQLAASAARHLGLPSEVPIIIAGGDAAVGAFGAGATEPESPLLMLSTGCQVMLPSNQPRDAGGKGWQLWPAATIPGMSPWLEVGATLNGGSAIGWARATFGETNNDLSTQLPRRDDPVCIPHMIGERFPVERTGPSGAFFDLGPNHDRAALLRASIVGVAMATADAFVTMGGEISTDAPMLVGGGGVRDDAWVAAISRTFDRPIQLVMEPDLSAWGAARMAAAQLGWADPTIDPDALLPELRRIDRPAIRSGEAAERLARYRFLARLVPGHDTGGES